MRRTSQIALLARREPLLTCPTRQYSDEAIETLSQRLNDTDFARIKKGLERAEEFLRSIPQDQVVNQKTLAMKDESLALALYESLCCMPFLSLPQNRLAFEYVFTRTQTKSPLALGEIVPVMTTFLFQGDQIQRNFANKAWQRIENKKLMNAEDFEWAVSPELTYFIQTVAPPNTPADRIESFWSGFLRILSTLDEDLIIHSLRAMEVQPDIYSLLLQHMETGSPDVLELLLRVFCLLINKSSKALWAAYASISIPTVAEQVFRSPAFRGLLVSPKYDAAPISEHPAVKWVPVFMNSISMEAKNDAASTMLYQFVDNYRKSTPPAAARICVRGGLEALYAALYPLQEIREHNVHSMLYLNSTVNLAIKYQGILIETIQLADACSRLMDDRGNYKLAMKTINSCLVLDGRAWKTERRLLTKGANQVPVKRQSTMLWNGLLQALQPGRTDLAITLTRAIIPLLDLFRFTPLKRGTLPEEQAAFNASYLELAETIGEMIRRLENFSEDELNAIVQDRAGVRFLFTALLHSQEPIRVAGVSLLKTAVDEDDREMALGKVLRRDFTGALQSFTYGIQTITSAEPAWGPLENVLSVGNQMLTLLCDEFGILREKKLDDTETEILSVWWASQWRWIDQTLRRAEIWAQTQEVKAVQMLCLRLMEFAESLMKQIAVVASAVSAKDPSDVPESTKTDNAMKQLLAEPALSMRGISYMLRLKDVSLVEITVNVLTRQLQRIFQNDVEIEPATLDLIRGACIAQPNGKYKIGTNMTDTQRAMLLSVVGEGSQDDVHVVEVRTIGRQKTLDGWSKSSRAETPPSKDSKDSKDVSAGAKTGETSTAASIAARLDVSSLTKHASKNVSLLSQLKAKHSAPAASAKPTLTSQGLALREARQREKEEMKRRNAEATAALKARALGNLAMVPGEGSGLLGIGVRGKVHGMPKSEIMVGDTSSEEDSDDDDDGDLAALGTRTKGGPDSELTDAERQRRLMLKAAKAPVKKIKVQRTAKDLRARIVPPMEALHHAILEWDIFHEGEDPPNMGPIEAVSDVYRDPVQYKRTFMPLLINEAWRSFVTAKEECTSKPFGVKVINRMTVDRFIEATTSVLLSMGKDRGLAEGDIVVLSTSPQPLDHPDQPHCLARIWKITFKREHIEVLYRISSKVSSMIQALAPQADIYAIKITNMTTIEREYAALESLQYYDLMEEVLSARPSHLLTFGNERVESVMANYKLNAAQAKAVLSARENDGFTLIQGPPGTGKTKTIVAMVGAHLTSTLAAAQSAGNKAAHVFAGGGTGPKEMPKKLLVCAPSNAAVDELVLRLKQGVKTMNGHFHKINVLRFGRSDAINAAVKDVTLDELVRARLEGTEGKSELKEMRENLHNRAGELKTKINELRPQLEAARAGTDAALRIRLEREFDQLKRDQALIGAKIDADKESGNTVAREMEIKRRQIQQEILNSAHVLCATLSGSGHEMFRNLQVEFETVIIDEAAQCVELSALIPLKYGCTKCILVGDPKQLPPTVLSQSAARFGYDQSLFVRMQRNRPDDVHLLDHQYRMHPAISAFPSQEFYEGRLVDGADMAKLRHQPWHDAPLLGPYRFFDVRGSQDRGVKGKSLVNVEEVKVALQLYERFRTDCGGAIDLRNKIGIITPYKAQLQLLRDEFARRYGEVITDEIEFNTTDAFQGRECEVIIFSCVRASPTGGIGFMTDIRRMNVGLTRARSSLWILGDSRALVQGEFWNKLIVDARRRNLYTEGDILAMLRQPNRIRLPPAKPKPDVNMSGVSSTAASDASSRQSPAPSRATATSSDALPSRPPQGSTKPSGPQPQPRPPSQHPQSRSTPAVTVPIGGPQGGFARGTTGAGGGFGSSASPAASQPYQSSPASNGGFGVHAPAPTTTGGRGDGLDGAAKKRSREPLPEPVIPPPAKRVGSSYEFTMKRHNACEKVNKLTRVSNTCIQSRQVQPPTVPGQPPPSLGDTDPSAMQVLGLVPPPRPPPQPAPSGSGGGGGSSANSAGKVRFSCCLSLTSHVSDRLTPACNNSRLALARLALALLGGRLRENVPCRTSSSGLGVNVPS